jgi:hypothetical protein
MQYTRGIAKPARQVVDRHDSETYLIAHEHLISG